MHWSSHCWIRAAFLWNPAQSGFLAVCFILYAQETYQTLSLTLREIGSQETPHSGLKPESFHWPTICRHSFLHYIWYNCNICNGKDSSQTPHHHKMHLFTASSKDCPYTHAAKHSLRPQPPISTWGFPSISPSYNRAFWLTDCFPLLCVLFPGSPTVALNYNLRPNLLCRFHPEICKEWWVGWKWRKTEPRTIKEKLGEHWDFIGLKNNLKAEIVETTLNLGQACCRIALSNVMSSSPALGIHPSHSNNQSKPTTISVETRARAGRSAVLTQVKANNFMQLDTLAKHSPANHLHRTRLMHWFHKNRVKYATSFMSFLLFSMLQQQPIYINKYCYLYTLTTCSTRQFLFTQCSTAKPTGWTRLLVMSVDAWKTTK